MGWGLSFFLYEHVLLYESKQVAPSAVAMAAVTSQGSIHRNRSL